MDKFINIDDIIDYCDANIPPLSSRKDTVACAALRRVKEFVKENIADVQPVVDTENMATVADEFICKKCGIYLKDYIKVVLDEDNDGYIDEQHYEYEPKFCPECGAKVKDGDNNAESNGSNHK